MKTIKLTVTILFLAVANIYSQDNRPDGTSYEIPLGSKKNIIEIELVNNSGIQNKGISMKVVDKPEWVKFQNSSAQIQGTESQVLNLESHILLFEFDIDKEAPVGAEGLLRFIVENQTGKLGQKEINIKVSFPSEYELFQNYPNPFNPSTIISYQLPVNGNVNLKIYDILGRELETILQKEQDAGFHKLEWNASKYSSGMYIYQLTTKNNNGENKIFRSKMLLVK